MTTSLLDYSQLLRGLAQDWVVTLHVPVDGADGHVVVTLNKLSALGDSAIHDSCSVVFFSLTPLYPSDADLPVEKQAMKDAILTHVNALLTSFPPQSNMRYVATKVMFHTNKLKFPVLPASHGGGAIGEG